VAQSREVKAIRDLTSHDATVMLSPNNAHAKETLALDEAGLTELFDMAFTRVS